LDPLVSITLLQSTIVSTNISEIQVLEKSYSFQWSAELPIPSLPNDSHQHSGSEMEIKTKIFDFHDGTDLYWDTLKTLGLSLRKKKGLI
jgi:hypothetical protein